MKILLVHNLYKQAGGEDSVFRAERDLLRSQGHMVEELLYDNSVIKSFQDKWRFGLKAIYNPDSARDITIKIKQFQPDVIHVHNFLPLVSPSIFFVAKRKKVPVVLTLHNYRLICPSATLFFDGQIYEKSIQAFFPIDAIWKGVYRNSRIQTAAVAFMTAIHSLLGTWRNKIDCYILLTQFARDKIQNSSLSLPKEKVIVKSNFTADFGEGNTKRQSYFLFVGRLTEEKGIRTLLYAVNLRNFKLVIIGDGPLRGLVENACTLNSNIFYAGFQSKSKVINYLKECKALVFPSIWYEGFPVTILEAFSTGTPVIASNIGSMQEIVQHEVNGLHFTPGDEQDLILKMNKVLKNDDLHKRLSRNARLSYINYYTPEKNYEQLMRIYKMAINSYSSRYEIKELALTEEKLAGNKVYQ
jgi:glycosyltransferase involved in cell wall biosynthesis